MSRINSHVRGMTLAETLVAMIVLGMFLTLVVAIVRPLLNAPAQVQAKTSTAQTAAQVLYRIGRDLRMSNANGIYTCTADVIPTCAAPTTALAGTTRIAIVTPIDANGQLQIDPTANAPAWTGVRTYCLIANASGTSDIRYGFAPIAGIAPGADGVKALSMSTVASGVAQACAATSATTVATNVDGIQLSVDPASGTIGLRLVARTNVGGKTNETTYRSEIHARN
jgi:type II secretory pathway pseudopilin PulG